VATPATIYVVSTNGNVRGGSVIDDAISALINLGYKLAEAKRAVDAVDPSDEKDDLESLIRKSLAIILGEN
jgi:Holliday junction resolvasome RuvABC DNA-binding subunit